MDSHLLSLSVKYHGTDLVSCFEKEQQEDVPQRIVEQMPKSPRADKEIGNEELQKKLKTFIARKADLLFKPLEDDVKVDFAGVSSEDKYAIMPPLESFMGVPSDVTREHFLKCLEKRDIIIGIVSSVLDNGLVVTLLCEDGGKARDIDVLKITAFCPVKELPKLYSEKSSTDVFKVKDIVRGVVISVNIETGKIFMSLLDRSLPSDREYPKLGLITEDDFPVYYRRKLHIRGLTFDELLCSILGFNNSGNVNFLLNQLNQKDFSSLSRSLHNLNVTEKDFAEKLRKNQSQRWARSSVAQGISYFKAGKQVEAIQHLNKALQIDKDNVDALVARGALYANNESYCRAIEDFEKALEVNPEHQNALTYMHETLLAKGRQFEDQGSFVEASEYYKRALSLMPGSQEVKECMRRLDLKKHRMKPAYGKRRERLSVSPDENSPKKTGGKREQSVSPIAKTKETLKKLIEDDKRGKRPSSKRRKSSESPPSPREHLSRKDQYYRDTKRESIGNRYYSEEKRNMSPCGRSPPGSRGSNSQKQYKEVEKRSSYHTSQSRSPSHARNRDFDDLSRARRSSRSPYNREESPQNSGKQESRSQIRSSKSRASVYESKQFEKKLAVSDSVNKDEHFKIAPLITNRSGNITSYEDFESQPYHFAPHQTDSGLFRTSDSNTHRSLVVSHKVSPNSRYDDRRRQDQNKFSDKSPHYLSPNDYEGHRRFESPSRRRESHQLDKKSLVQDDHSLNKMSSERNEHQKRRGYSFSPDHRDSLHGSSYSSRSASSKKKERHPLKLISPQREKMYSPNRDIEGDRCSRRYSSNRNESYEKNPRNDNFPTDDRPMRRDDRYEQEGVTSHKDEKYSDDYISSHGDRSSYRSRKYSRGMSEQDAEYYSKHVSPRAQDRISQSHDERCRNSPDRERNYFSPNRDSQYFSPLPEERYSRQFTSQRGSRDVYTERPERYERREDDTHERHREFGRSYNNEATSHDRPSGFLSPISSAYRYSQMSPCDDRSHRLSISPRREHEHEKYARHLVDERQGRMSPPEWYDRDDSDRTKVHPSRHSLDWRDRQVSMQSRNVSHSPNRQSHRESFSPSNRFTDNRFMDRHSQHEHSRQVQRSHGNGTPELERTEHEFNQQQGRNTHRNIELGDFTRQHRDRGHGEEREVFFSRHDREHSPDDDIYSRKVEVSFQGDKIRRCRDRYRGNSPWEIDKDDLGTGDYHQRRRSHRSVTPSPKSKDSHVRQHEDRTYEQTEKVHLHERLISNEDQYLYGEKLYDRSPHSTNPEEKKDTSRDISKYMHDHSKRSHGSKHEKIEKDLDRSTDKDKRKKIYRDKESPERTKRVDKDSYRTHSGRKKSKKDEDEENDGHIEQHSHKDVSPVSRSSSKKKKHSKSKGKSKKQSERKSETKSSRESSQLQASASKDGRQPGIENTARVLVFPEMKSKWDNVSPNVHVEETNSKEGFKISKFSTDYGHFPSLIQPEDKLVETSTPDKMTKLLQYISETRPKRGRSVTSDGEKRSSSSSSGSSDSSSTDDDSDSSSSDSDSRNDSDSSRSRMFQGRNILRPVESIPYGRRIIGLHDRLSDEERKRSHSKDRSKKRDTRRKSHSKERRSRSLSYERHKSHTKRKRSASKHRSRSHERNRSQYEKRTTYGETTGSLDKRRSRRETRSRSYSGEARGRSKQRKSHLPDLVPDSTKYEKKKDRSGRENKRTSTDHDHRDRHDHDHRDRHDPDSRRLSKTESEGSAKKTHENRGRSDKRYTTGKEDKGRKRKLSSPDRHERREEKRMEVPDETRQKSEHTYDASKKIPSPDKKTLADLEVFLNSLKDKQKEQWKAEGKLKPAVNM